MPPKNGWNKPCVVCGEDMYVTPASSDKQTCSRACEGKRRSEEMTGEDNPFFGKKHKEETKEKIRESLGDMSGKNNPMFGRGEDRMGEDNPFYGKTHSQEFVDWIAEHNRELMLEMWQNEEYSKKVSEALSGENHWNFQGWKTLEPYGPGFTDELKREIRAEYEHECVRCGISAEEVPQNLHVHHIDGDKKNNEKTNLITLCGSCHITVERSSAEVV